MDGPRFDTLARTLAASRRTSRKTLLGAGLALLLAGRGRDAAAACKQVGQGCNRDNDCCKGGECQGGDCQCKSGFTDCSGRCKNLSINENHCGACDTGCGRGETCCSGACAGDFLTDPDHCGACDIRCANGEICLAGVCTPCPIGNELCGDTCCPPFETCCDGTCVDDVQSNPDHCGACGNRCGGPRCCNRGRCITSFQSDEDNCGSCGFECQRPPVTPNPHTCCSGGCRNLPTDENHCGACGNACPAGTFCDDGPGGVLCRCFSTDAPCGPGQGCCDGDCLDLEDNRNHCGRCDRACNNTSICTDGRCVSCPPGRIACGNVCCLP